MIKKVKCKGLNVKVEVDEDGKFIQVVDITGAIVDREWEEFLMKCYTEDEEDDKGEYAEYCENQLIGDIPVKIEHPQLRGVDVVVNNPRVNS